MLVAKLLRVIFILTMVPSIRPLSKLNIKIFKLLLTPILALKNYGTRNNNIYKYLFNGEEQSDEIIDTMESFNNIRYYT